MKFVIDTSKWLRGEKIEDGLGGSKLLRVSDGKMCCLGFFGIACGLRRSQLEDRAAPCDLKTSKFPKWLWKKNPEPGFDPGVNSADCQKLMETNDDPNTSDSHKKWEISQIFAKHRVKVEFVDGPAQ